MVCNHVMRQDITIDWLSIATSDDEVERVAIAMSRTTDGLHEIERFNNLSKLLRTSISRVVDVGVEVAADNDRTAVRGDDLEQTNELLEEQRWCSQTAGSVDDNVCR